MTNAVVTVSDTVLGYGSSQILSITRGLADLVGGDHLIFQPFVPQRKYVDLSKEGYRVETITSFEHPWTWIGRMQYLRRVARAINESRPDVLILPNYNMIPIIDLLSYRPKKIIHVALEDLDQFGESKVAQKIVRKIKQQVGKIDIWVFPEQNRAMNDCNQLGIPYDRICFLYNVSQDGKPALPAKERNGKIIYAGSVDFDRTVAHFFHAPDVAREAIDVFGGFGGSPELRENFITATRAPENKIRYFGEISAGELGRQLPAYCYSLVYWFPQTWALRNAAPNKFFQAIASGVPVIAAPHPQCVSLIERYGCGIALKDWEYTTFLEGLESAFSRIGTAEYQKMVDGCRKAFAEELNWETQFSKLTTLFQGNGK
ncbi:MAG: hypothetical protein JSR19_05735 [Proteobacteria bacterium]|nr:hypothetical protein [Pseudomonadota bacterium]HQR04676.1 hypothetical protein [Rhodocyclaceae bacterium]